MLSYEIVSWLFLNRAW